MAWNDQTAPQQRPDVRPRWKKKRYWIPAAGLAAFVGLGTVAAVTAPPVKDPGTVRTAVDAATSPAPTTTAPTPEETTPAPTSAPATVHPVTTAPRTRTVPPPVHTTRAPAPRTVAPAPTTRPRPAPTTVRPKPAPTRTTPPPTPPPAGAVHPGAFCSPEGATGHTAKGTLMRCTRKPGEDRARWRKA